MVSRKEMAARDGAAVVNVNTDDTPIPKRVLRPLPGWLRFVLVAIISLSAHTALYSFVAPLSNYELSGVSRTLNEAWQPAALLGYKILELALAWYMKFDYFDLTALTLLTHGPFWFFLTTFYAITPYTALCALGSDVIALALPFRLLRPKLAAHSRTAPSPNKSIINDLQVITLTSALGAGIYGVIIYASFATWLLPFLITHFDGLRTFDSAHTALLPALVGLALPLGWATRIFLFDSSLGAKPNLGAARKSAFNPETATLGEQFYYTLWGYDIKARVLLQRLFILLAMQAANSWSRLFITIEGADAVGSAGWAGLWVSATVVVGLVIGWVSNARVDLAMWMLLRNIWRILGLGIFAVMVLREAFIENINKPPLQEESCDEVMRELVRNQGGIIRIPKIRWRRETSPDPFAALRQQGVEENQAIGKKGKGKAWKPRQDSKF